MSNSYSYYVYRCTCCGTRTILKNDKYNPFYKIENDKEIVGTSIYEQDIKWICPPCYEKFLNQKGLLDGK